MGFLRYGGFMKTDPREFWEAKILDWEEGRYSKPNRRLSIMERLANRSSMSLRFRTRITPELLGPHLAGKRVIEVGCGSGLLAERIIRGGAAAYVGIDLAKTAIEAAQKRVGSVGGRVQFLAGDISRLGEQTGDIVFSLGLLDWLTDDQLRNLFNLSGKAEFLHAIAEKRMSIQQLIHRSYVHMAYGHFSGGYKPRYFEAKLIRGLAAAAHDRPVYAYRDWRLSFGALISSFPIGPQIAP